MACLRRQFPPPRVWGMNRSVDRPAVRMTGRCHHISAASPHVGVRIWPTWPQNRRSHGGGYSEVTSCRHEATGMVSNIPHWGFDLGEYSSVKPHITLSQKVEQVLMLCRQIDDDEPLLRAAQHV